MNCTPKVRHKTFGVQFIAGVGDFFCFFTLFLFACRYAKSCISSSVGVAIMPLNA